MKRRSEIASGQARQKGKSVYAFTASDEDEVRDDGRFDSDALQLMCLSSCFVAN